MKLSGANGKVWSDADGVIDDSNVAIREAEEAHYNARSKSTPGPEAAKKPSSSVINMLGSWPSDAIAIEHTNVLGQCFFLRFGSATPQDM